ncbi:hypothetical protein ACFVDH_30625 [Streptomyces sp. NPDC057674]|uniref:hypothetical protein n=1 Tax=Streptomyces sp. NPDC057674 TaxID=3346203 RepID=UPI00367CDFBF
MMTTETGQHAPETPETLAGLVSEAVGDRGKVGPTFEQLAERCVDPVTGYRPSANLLWRVARAKGVKVNPELVAAIAVGLELPLARVQAAAAYEFTGFVTTALEGGEVTHMPDAPVNAEGKSAALMRSWAEEESQPPYNHSAE